MSNFDSGPDKFTQGNADIGTQFLLADFASLREFKEQSVQISDKRVDILLALSSALVGGLGILSQTKIDSRTFIIVALYGSLGLLAVGLTIFRHVVDRDILTVDYIRAINRIRCYFAEQIPGIQPYLLMPISHEYPPYDWQSSNRQIPMVVNSLLIGALVTLGTLFIRDTTTPDVILLGLSAIAFLAVYGLQRRYATGRFQSAEIKAMECRTKVYLNPICGFANLRRKTLNKSYRQERANKTGTLRINHKQILGTAISEDGQVCKNAASNYSSVMRPRSPTYALDHTVRIFETALWLAY